MSYPMGRTGFQASGDIQTDCSSAKATAKATTITPMTAAVIVE